MRMKIGYITVLFLGLAFSVSAQKKKAKAKHPARKQAVAKKDTKRQPVPKAKEIKREAGKDSTTLKSATIEILQSYKPEVKLPPKPEVQASLPPVDVSTPKQQYTVPAQSLYYTYNSLPLRPLILGKDSLGKGFESYVKLGAGNIVTFIDAGIGHLHGPKYESVIHIHHTSMVKDELQQKTLQSAIEANATVHTRKNDLYTSFEAYREVYNLYGFATSGYDSKARYYGLKVGVGLKPANKLANTLIYDPAVGFLVHNGTAGGPGTSGGTEKQFVVDVLVAYQENEDLKLYCGIKGLYDNVSSDLTSFSESYMLQLSPGIEYNKNGIELKAGLYPTLGTHNLYLLPDISTRYNITGTQIALYAGIKGWLKQNSYAELAMWNPYVEYNMQVDQTHANELFIGAQTNISHHITLSGRLSYWQYDNMLMFINDTSRFTFGNRSVFQPVFDRADAISLQGSVRYQVAENVAVGVTGIYTGYNADDFRYVWHEPGVRFNADLSVKPIPQLTVTGYLSFFDETYAVDYNNATVKLPAALDIGAGAEYNFMPRLSAFAQVKNILNNQYQRWYGYPVYGFNIYAGIRLKF